MLANALGTVPTPGPHARNPRARRGCCLCPAACFASGTPDLVGLFCSREGLLLRPGYRQTRGAVLKMTALAASQGNLFGGTVFGDQPALMRPMGFRDVVKQAAAYAVSVALKVTAIVIHLARMTVVDVQKAWLRQEAEARAAEHREAEAVAVRKAQEMMDAQRRRKSLRLMKEAQDVAFQEMLKTMDDTSINLEDKWASIQRHTGKSEFSRHVRKLFTVAGESSMEVQNQAVTASTMWKSSITQAVIVEEAALKRLIFQQMLQGGQA